MQWLRLHLPVLYLASILLAGAVPCASHAAGYEAGSVSTHHQPQHAMEGESEAPCHSGEAVCGCDTMSERWQAVAVKSRNENAAPAVALDVSGAVEVERHLLFARSDPPDRQFHSISFYDGIHGRWARLLI